jgi:hypothetical protein
MYLPALHFQSAQCLRPGHRMSGQLCSLHCAEQCAQCCVCNAQAQRDQENILQILQLSSLVAALLLSPTSELGAVEGQI